MHSVLKKREKRGRTERLEARVKIEQKKLFERAAALQGRTVTDFVLMSAEEAAVRTIQNYDLIQLTGRDRAFLVSSILNPPTPSKKLHEAAARYKARMGL